MVGEKVKSHGTERETSRVEWKAAKNDKIDQAATLYGDQSQRWTKESVLNLGGWQRAEDLRNAKSQAALVSGPRLSYH